MIKLFNFAFANKKPPKIRIMKKDLIYSILIIVMLFPTLEGLYIETEQTEKKIVVKTKLEKKDKKTLFGFNETLFKVIKSKIKPGMYLSNLFAEYDIDKSIVTKILQKTKDVFDVRKIKRGNDYSVFLTRDSTEEIKYIVYEKNPIDYVVFDFTDTLNVYTDKKEVSIKVKTAGGIIESSLWFAMEDAGINPLISNDLSEIYAWSIDFFGLQKGDRFKLIYDEKFVAGKSIGFGKIHAAYFEHYGKKIYAVPFLQDSIESFYDVDGNSLRKAFLKAPLKYSRISSHFSHARRHPILKIVRPHHGIDYAAPMGTPVYALGDGTVIRAAYTGGAGNYIKIKHNGVYTTGYMHLKGYAKGIKAGARVTQGQLIGFVGSTGLSTGAHLDFRIWKNGHACNPLKIDAPPVEPVKEENIAEFDKIKKSYKKKLDEIKYTVKEVILLADGK